MSDLDFYLPWEHSVCSKCFRLNPHAIWLVKLRCFEMNSHKRDEEITVVIDRDLMKMTEVRPLPENYARFRGKFWMCRDILKRGVCKQLHSYPHSQAEYDSWNAKKTILQECPDVVDELLDLEVANRLPSKVCLQCLVDVGSSTAPWLTYLTCIKPDEHNGFTNTFVVYYNDLFKVRMPSHLRQITNLSEIKMCDYIPKCSRKEKCKFAHSLAELEYWRCVRAKEIFCSNLPELIDGSDFEELCDRYSYPNEKDDVITNGVQCELSCDNYKSKFHKLVFLDDLELTRKMARECDGEVTIEVGNNTIYITEMKNGTVAMDYASQNKCTVKFSVNNCTYETELVTRGFEKDSLSMGMNQRSGFFREFKRDDKLKVFAHFEMIHWYFWRLHCAISIADSQLISRLVEPQFKRSRSSHIPSIRRAAYGLDREYQLQALKKMLSCKPGAPYLLLGPFGTGKTHVLAAAVQQLMEDPKKRILVCTHQNAGADKLYLSLQDRLHAAKVAKCALRVVADQGMIHNKSLMHPYSCEAVRNISIQRLSKWSVIITTFSTALAIKDKQHKEGCFLHFSNIIIDEGAQSREPEALGPLVLADVDTHIIIAGDHQQVGPKVAVCNKIARDNGLGTSLLERLFSHYQLAKAESSHASTLLTNYRCHSSILMLASSLFYQCTLLSRSDSKALPGAPFPLVFECSSTNDNSSNAPAENVEEANILVNRMMDFIQNDWPKSAKQTSVGLLASTRKQTSHLKKAFKKECKRRKVAPNNLPCLVEIITTSIIQGQEFTAVFLSTVEPTNEQGKSRNPVRSVCNEYVFNTIITRARCLVYAIGNPFLLLHVGNENEFSVNCWKEYIQRCVTCQTFILPKAKSPESIQQLPNVMSTISNMVLPLQQLNEAVSGANVEEDVDKILKQYMKVFTSRDEQRACFSLVQDPKGMKYWKYEGSDSEDSDSDANDDVILVKLKFDSYRTGVAIPEDTTQAPLPITTLHGRRGGFQDDVVKYDVRNKCILLDKDTEKAFNSQHFAASFLCRVNTRNPVEFFPLDTTYPKFINLPTLTKKEREGVVMFDPSSINKCPRMNNFIPMQRAVNMVFIVKFLRWRKQFNYPLGIIVGALPSGQSVESGDLLLRVAHCVPLEEQHVQFRKPLIRPHGDGQPSPPLYENAIAIDPEGSHDHDDALTCHRNDIPARPRDSQKVIYVIGVHITNVMKYVRQGSELDKVAFKRGCSVYRASDCCISNMLPPDLIREASLKRGCTRDSFSVIGSATINAGVVESFSQVKIIPSRVKCECELTYSEAQAVLYSGRSDNSLHTLWKVASFLRSKRLGEAAFCYIAGESNEELHPEAHMLVEEFMIWANQSVASLLVEKFPEKAIVRRQPPPNGSDLDLLKKENTSLLSTSCDLRQYVPHVRSVEDFHILQTVYDRVVGLLEDGKVTAALHYIQFEHLHPQTAVAHSLFNQIRAPSSYLFRAILQDVDDVVTSHHSLNVEHYTRFTSPLRRFVDLVIQRFLNAALQNEECPYQDDEKLKEICTEVRDSEKKADAYGSDMKKLILACQLRQNGREYFCFIKKIERGQIQLTFPDRELKSINKNRIPFRTLNTSGQSKLSPKNSTASLSQERDCDTDGGNNYRYQWKAKVASVTGFPAIFLKHSHLQLVTQQAVEDDDSSDYSDPGFSDEEHYESLEEEGNGYSSEEGSDDMLELGEEESNDSFEESEGESYEEEEREIGSERSITSGCFAEISFFMPVETQEDERESPLKEEKAMAIIKPFTSRVTQRNWKEIQKYVRSDPNKIHSDDILDLLDPDNTEESDLPPAGSSYHKCRCPLWIYTVHRPLRSCDVMRAQLTANFNQYTHTLTPSVQLLEVGPGLRICIQHSSNPIECFTDRPTEKASRVEYNSINEYFRFWEQVILAEAAASSLSDSDLLLIKDVGLQWPALEMKVDPTGHVYYQLPTSRELTSKSCVSVTFPREFAMSSSGFFPFSAGDLVCLRCDREGTNEGGDNDGPVRCVFHMIVHDVDNVTIEEDKKKEIVEINVYLRFVSERLNYISPQFNRVIQTDKRSIKYELQLIRLTLPARRIYQSLREMVTQQSNKGYTLAQKIVLGEARYDNPRPPPVETKLPAAEAKVATTLWNTSSSIDLNNYQREAVKLALTNKFVMIQGPPGTGKSVTGAHIAYALAIKLQIETAYMHRGSDEPSPCVMYCGPSQQSVNVVLKVLLSCAEVKNNLNIIRVYSKAIENKDYQGTNYHPDVFRKIKTDGECDEACVEYALHHIVRKKFPIIREREEKFRQLQKQGKIPSDAKRRDFHNLVTRSESVVLKGGVDIVLCTCNEASSARITSSLKPVYLVVDECAMSTEPESMVPIRLADNVVLIGDHNQLQPVIQNQEAREMGLGISLFERYAEVLGKMGRSPHLLQEQYRMLPCLCAFPSQEFYDGKLITSRTVVPNYLTKLKCLKNFWPTSQKQFVFCDVVGSEDEHHTSQDGAAAVGVESKRNNKEAKKIAQIAKTLIENYGVGPAEIAAITPYSAQREEIRRELKNIGVRNVRVKTITDSQGSEFGIVLLSTVRSKNIKDITYGDGHRMKADFGWIKANLGFITDRHQICVGITRCKYGLVIVGNRTLLSYDATWRKLIEHYQNARCIVNGDAFPRRVQAHRFRRAPPQ